MPAFVTVRQAALSLWQSAVYEATARMTDITPEQRDHMRQGVNQHVLALSGGPPLPPPSATGGSLQPADQAALSGLHFATAQARVGAPTPATAPDGIDGHWAYSDDDLHWLECIALYNKYYVLADRNAAYRDWTKEGRNDSDYGVLPYQLPDDATVLVIGDWGTGMNDAVTMLKVAVKAHRPTAILHLGDVYYSGTVTECTAHVSDVLNHVFAELNIARIPVFMIPGNHEYYSGGAGFYATIDTLNPGLPGCQQQASYFCLRTQDRRWQFLAMDTGLGDHNGDLDALGQVVANPLATGPSLAPSEATWHADKLSRFSGSTILMSHHPLFSANAGINGSATGRPAYLNTGLLSIFQPHFGGVAAWFWGHEHNFVYYKPGLFGLSRGRLLGNSAYEEMQASNPYNAAYPEVPYAPDMKQVGITPYASGNGTYYNHAYAVIKLARATPPDPVSIDYYEYPSWGGSTSPEPLPAPSLLFSERLEPSAVS